MKDIGYPNFRLCTNAFNSLDCEIDMPIPFIINLAKDYHKPIAIPNACINLITIFTEWVKM